MHLLVIYCWEHFMTPFGGFSFGQWLFGVSSSLLGSGCLACPHLFWAVALWRVLISFGPVALWRVLISFGPVALWRVLISFGPVALWCVLISFGPVALWRVLIKSRFKWLHLFFQSSFTSHSRCTFMDRN